jgi:hypothetical protein
VAVAAAVQACSRTPAPGSSLAGAPTAREAATGFLNAAKAQDLQAMSAVWGTEQGPARDRLERTDLEKRLVIMQACYDHDRYQIVSESPRPNSANLIRVTLSRGRLSRTASFLTVRGPSNRYYVKDADYNAVRDFCAR